MRRLLFLLAVGVLLGGCQQQELFSNVAQRDANEMLAVLERSGISATIKPSGQAGRVAVVVPQEDVATAASVLRRVGLPRPEKTPLSEVLPQDSWMASRSQENARLAYGLGQDLSATITQINGVREARVHVALAEKNSIGQVETKPSASVLVRYDSQLLDPEVRFDVAALISNAVPGLTFDRVAVTMVPDNADVSLTLGQPTASTDSSGMSFQFFLQIIIAVCLAGLLAWLVHTMIVRRAT